MYPPVQRLKIVYDKDLFFHKNVLIKYWKEKSYMALNREMFESYYMFNLSLTSRETDSFIQVAFTEKYAALKILDFILSHTNFDFVVDHTVFCSEKVLLDVKQQYGSKIYVFDPLEFKHKKGWQ